MKQFACGDVIPGCSATFRRDTKDQLLDDVALHARREHGLTDIPTPILAKVHARITDTKPE